LPDGSPTKRQLLRPAGLRVGLRRCEFYGKGLDFDIVLELDQGGLPSRVTSRTRRCTLAPPSPPPPDRMVKLDGALAGQVGAGFD
jgi:hypothetical protein